MKKYTISLIILTALNISINLNSYSQTEQGNITVGGSIGLTQDKTEVGTYKIEVFSVNINPNISYAIIDGLFVGINFPFSSSTRTNTSNLGSSDNKFSQFSVGPNIRYYHSLGGVSIFPTLGYSIGKSKQGAPSFDPITQEMFQTTLGAKIKQITLGVGIAYFLNNNLSLDAILSYSKQNLEFDTPIYPDYPIQYWSKSIS